MERAAVLSCDDGVLADHLPTWISDTVTSEPAYKAAPSSERAPLSVDSLEQLDAARDALERRRIVDALDRCGGNQTRAAAELGITRRTLVARLGEYGLLLRQKKL
jgi:DNA-binding NtrC family response regulator